MGKDWGYQIRIAWRRSLAELVISDVMKVGMTHLSATNCRFNLI